VIATLLYGYLAGWVLTIVGLALVVRRKPLISHPVRVTIAAGAAWPVLLLGVAQLAVVALAAEAVRRRRSEDVEQPLPVAPLPEREKVSD
jgi:ABC-type Mn2+/Zn2+ transport system permease subunit